MLYSVNCFVQFLKFRRSSFFCIKVSKTFRLPKTLNHAEIPFSDHRYRIALRFGHGHSAPTATNPGCARVSASEAAASSVH